MKSVDDATLRRLGGLIARDNAPLGLVIHTRYEVVKRIARGGMGEIFYARDRRIGRPVAMKILASSLAGPEWTARFQEEARTMGRIEHPGIVPIHDLGVLPDGRLYYTMKLIEGLTLHELMEAGEERGRLLEILARTAEVVHHAHENGVIHRDLKPSNVMAGDDGEVYVLDWGIARVRDEIYAADGGKPSTEGLTSPGTVLGTLQYMPPEQARGDSAAIDARSDVYALGAILYEILAGVPPVRGTGATEILEKASRGAIEPPRRHDPALAADLESVCLKALHRSPRQRYGSAREFAEDLRRWLAGDPVRGHPGGVRYRLSKIVRKRRWQVATAAVMLAGLLSFGVYWLTHRGDAAVAEAKRTEDEVFGPIRKRMESLPHTREGRARAIQLLDDGIRRHAGAWDAWMMKGSLHERLHQDDEALAAFRRAADLNPRLGAAHYRRGRILMDRRRDEQGARAAFEEALRVEPENEHALVGQARLALLRKDYSRAIEICGRTEPIGRHAYDLYFVRGNAYAQAPPGLRDLEQSIRDHTRVLDLAPGHVSAYLNRGVARELAGDPDGAIADLTRALQMDPEYALAYVNRSSAHLKKRAWDPALADADRAITLDPRLKEAHLNRGAALAGKADHEAALRDYGRALEIDPAFAAAYYNRGNARRARGEHRAAIADYDRAVEIDPRYVEAWTNRANAKADLGEVEEALADYARAIEVDPGHSRAYNGRGTLRLARRELEGAQADFARAIELDSRYAIAWSNRGLVRHDRGDRDGAMADFAKAIELDPGIVQAYVGRGNTRRARGDLEGAIDDWSRAIQLDPRQAMALHNRGTARAQRGDRAGAIEDLSRAIELNPRYASAYLNRSGALAQNGDRVGAIRDLEKALELAPADWPHRAPAEAQLRAFRK